LLLKILFIVLVTFFFAYLFLFLKNKKYILNADQIDHFKYALVLGAGLEKDCRPSDILMDRIATAVQLYRSQKVDFLIMSGAAKRNKDEVKAMTAAARAQGIPDSAILQDGDGYSTFESCLHVIREYSPIRLLIVTQRFHLTRAITMQRWLGVEAFGCPARIYHFTFYKTAYWYLREIAAMPYNILKFLLYSWERSIFKLKAGTQMNTCLFLYNKNLTKQSTVQSVR
jgi:SanA protein